MKTGLFALGLFFGGLAGAFAGHYHGVAVTLQDQFVNIERALQ